MLSNTEVVRKNLETSLEACFARLEAVRAVTTSSHRAFGYANFAAPLLQSAQSYLHAGDGDGAESRAEDAAAWISEAQEYLSRAESDLQTVVPESVSL